MADLTIASARLLPYRLGLSRESGFGDERIGRLVRLEDAGGHVGWGDVAPLPGFSRESLAGVDEEWNTVHSVLLDGPVNADDILNAEETVVERFAASSLRFGIEQAVIHLATKAVGVRLSDFIAPNGPKSIRLAALVTGIGDLAVEEASELADDGYGAIKVKVGRGSVDADVETILSIRQAIGPDVDLRLDANRSWSFREAVRFLDGVQDAAPEFIEEPLADPADAERLCRENEVRLALDETLVSISPQDLREWSFATHLVIKPTLAGGLRSAGRFIEAAGRLGIKCVVSASYESGLGTAMLACLAARWCPDGPAAGLDTYRRLGTDVLQWRLQVGSEMYLPNLALDIDNDFDSS